MSSLMLSDQMPTIFKNKTRLSLDVLWHIGGILVFTILGSKLSWQTGQFWTAEFAYHIIAYTWLAYILGLFVGRRLMAQARSRSVAAVFLSVSIFYLIMLSMISFSRVYYSRTFIGIAFIITLLWQWLSLVFLIRVRPRLGLMPVGMTRSLQSLSGAEWVELNEPNEVENVDGLVCDLHEEIAPPWLRYIAESSLRGIPIYHAASVYEMLTGRVSLEHYTDTIVRSFSLPPLYPHLKRLADLLTVLITLPIVLPISVMISVAVKLDSPGKVFFTQIRVGQRGKLFKLVKFRTMYTDNGDNDASFASIKDKRVTKVGKLLRRTRLDELPQLWNVLKGEMSIIGPRPEQVTFVEEFTEKIPLYPYRHVVKPGIAGWAQVHQGYAADVEETIEKVSYDLYYVKYFSLWMDMLIVSKTLKTMMTGYGAR